MSVFFFMATVKHDKRDNNHILVLLAETISYINVSLEKPSNEDIHSETLQSQFQISWSTV